MVGQACVKSVAGMLEEQAGKFAWTEVHKERAVGDEGRDEGWMAPHLVVPCKEFGFHSESESHWRL